MKEEILEIIQTRIDDRKRELSYTKQGAEYYAKHEAILEELEELYFEVNAVL